MKAITYEKKVKSSEDLEEFIDFILMKAKLAKKKTILIYWKIKKKELVFHIPPVETEETLVARVNELSYHLNELIFS